MHEVEIKLPFDSAHAARGVLERLGARLVQRRDFEDNTVFDRATDSLRAAGKVLRLRRFGDVSLLTLKLPVEGSHRHKVRAEYETRVDDFDAMLEVLDGLGFTRAYRYQKHRTVYGLEDLHICLDETPIGCFVELEGPPKTIDRVAALMGFTTDEYVCATYRELHEQAIRDGIVGEGDLLVDGAEVGAP